MRRNQHEHSTSICEQLREPAQQQQYRHHHHHHHHHNNNNNNNRHHNHNNHRTPLHSTSVAREQHIGHRMSLETLLQAAYYVEQEEKKRERLASTSSSSSSSDQHSFVSAPPHSNHTYVSSEPRGEYHAPVFGNLLWIVVKQRGMQRHCVALLCFILLRDANKIVILES